MIEPNRLPPGWTTNGTGAEGSGGNAGCSADVNAHSKGRAEVQFLGPLRDGPDQAAEDLYRLAWALEFDYDPRALRIEIERLHADLATAERDRDYNHAMWVEVRNERADLLRRVEALRRIIAGQQATIDHLSRPVAVRVLRRITEWARR